MHELAVTESILNIALTHAEKAQAARVTDIYIVLGQLSSVVDDSVQFYWDMIAEKTLCAGAKLHFERIPATFTCLDCQNTYPLKEMLTPCPNCGSIRLRVVTGEEFYLDSIEITKESEQSVS